MLFFQEKYNVKLEEDKLKEYLDEVNSYQQKHVVAVSYHILRTMKTAVYSFIFILTLQRKIVSSMNARTVEARTVAATINVELCARKVRLSVFSKTSLAYKLSN